MQAKKRSLKKTLIILSLTLCAMFGVAFALVPMYNVMCKVAGVNGKPDNTKAENVNDQVDETRWVTIEFMTTNNASLPWEFHPDVPSMRVHPGAVNLTNFYAENLTDHEMTIQAIPSVSPGLAAKYLKKLECFCFTQQTMQAHTGREMPLQFIISPDIPKDMRTISLSYTLFDLTDALKHKEPS